ncbi:hypothetical protein [Streptomyces sp. NBC_00286]|uniref:hypothetical protein n=1 Tax=Streptomyces sp. NBC_00286 TaxID=2975701 RepID=UPI002E2B68C5|nr:hypothetical protein [Streptomyces sp. NBC_00286]
MTDQITERDGGTAVSVRTDLKVTGRPAQFGRGVRPKWATGWSASSRRACPSNWTQPPRPR